jgi:ribokinase
MIGARVRAVTVSLADGGATAVVDGEALEIERFDVGHAVDSTGATDLFVAAWAWGDTVGLPVAETLRWAELYAALSVRVPTGAAGATPLDELMEEGARRGLPAPPARTA